MIETWSLKYFHMDRKHRKSNPDTASLYDSKIQKI